MAGDARTGRDYSVRIVQQRAHHELVSGHRNGDRVASASRYRFSGRFEESAPDASPTTHSLTGAAPSRAVQSGWVGLGLLAGAVLPLLGAINAQPEADIGGPLGEMPWWGWLGGFCAAYVTATFLVIPTTGPR